MTAWWLALAAVAAFASWYLTGRVRRYALARMIVDLPNARSSHSRPVPRGAGLAVAASILATLSLAGALGWVPLHLVIGLVGGGAAVAAVGWADDRRSLSPKARATVQFLAACWALAWMGGLPVVHIGTVSFRLGPGGWVLGVLAIMWGTNLYNFMDGIDGLAGGEGVTVGVLAALLLADADRPDLAGISVLVAASAAGFLVWNRPPARIFLGDAGSGLLGFAFAALAVASENANGLPLAAWVILMGTFFVDATLTVARRIARGERWYQAHRSHAYQRAVQSGLTHGQVTLGMLAMNVPLAALVWLGRKNPAAEPAVLGTGLAVLIVAYLLVERRRPIDGP